jgi:hypothetical protein
LSRNIERPAALYLCGSTANTAQFKCQGERMAVKPIAENNAEKI